MKKIAVITGARADYGILYPVLKEIKKRKQLELQLIVTGAHFSHELGYTIKEIEKDGFKIAAKVDMLLADDTGARMARSIGVGVLEFVQVFEMLQSDITLLMGDREEMFAAAIASVCQNIPVAHIHGGEVGTGGHIDESIRHALTKFSHLHFPATKKSAERIKKLGEEPWRIHLVGAPFVDNVKARTIPSPKALAKKFDLDLRKPLILVVQHPLAIEATRSKEHMKATLAAVASFELPTIVVYPNADAGGQEIIDVIRDFTRFSFIKAYKNFASADYLGLLKTASVLVGNSSSGIVEAPVFGLPAVNIGPRQHGREVASSILHADYSTMSIKKAVQKALYDKRFRAQAKHCQSFYGTGNASRKIVDILVKTQVNQKLLHKIMTF